MLSFLLSSNFEDNPNWKTFATHLLGTFPPLPCLFQLSFSSLLSIPRLLFDLPERRARKTLMATYRAAQQRQACPMTHRLCWKPQGRKVQITFEFDEELQGCVHGPFHQDFKNLRSKRPEYPKIDLQMTSEMWL